MIRLLLTGFSYVFVRCKKKKKKKKKKARRRRRKCAHLWCAARDGFPAAAFSGEFVISFIRLRLLFVRRAWYCSWAHTAFSRRDAVYHEARISRRCFLRLRWLAPQPSRLFALRSSSPAASSLLRFASFIIDVFFRFILMPSASFLVFSSVFDIFILSFWMLHDEVSYLLILRGFLFHSIDYIFSSFLHAVYDDLSIF